MLSGCFKGGQSQRRSALSRAQAQASLTGKASVGAKGLLKHRGALACLEWGLLEEAQPKPLDAAPY